MYSDMFVLKDADGNELTRRKLIGHIKEFYDGLDRETLKYPLKVTSGTSGYVFTITKDTTSQDWRDYGKDCVMACD